MIPINLNWAITLNSLCCRKPFRNIWIFHAFSTLKSFNLQTESRTKNTNHSISIAHFGNTKQTRIPDSLLNISIALVARGWWWWWWCPWLIADCHLSLGRYHLVVVATVVMVPGINQLRIRCGCWCLLVRPPSQTCNYFQIWTNCIILIN